jgi:hypothetical protein
MKEIIIEIRFFNITYRWEVDENYRNEYMEDYELTELKKIDEYKVEYSRRDDSKLAYYYFATKYHIIPPDDLFYDYNDYTDEGEIEVLKEILEELTPQEILTFEFEVSHDYIKRKKSDKN